MNTYWISFSDGKHLGCCIVDAIDEDSALQKTNDLGINPGGEAMIILFPENDSVSDGEIVRWGKDRIITTAELDAEGYTHTKDLDFTETAILVTHPSVTIREQEK